MDRIPLLLCLYLLPRTPLLPAFFATLVSTVVCFRLSHVVPGIALWSFGGLIILFTGAIASFNMHDLWSMVKEDE